MWPDRRILDLLHIDTPILLAPMAGAGVAELAIGVAGAGGVRPRAAPRCLDARGWDEIIAGGAEAGGHRGVFLADPIAACATQPGTMALVPQVVDAVSKPVIAAGGIADGRGIVAALALGAAAVQIG